MGRKIPAKRHRGVKDPEKQRAKRLAELESRTNAAPRDVDEQAIPKSLERLMKLKEAAKTSTNSVSKRKRRRKNQLICVGQQQKLKSGLHPKAKPEKVVPVFQQRPNESGEEFFHRVSRETHAFLKETAFEKKYSVQIDRNPETGQIQGLTKCKREKDDIETLRTKHKNIKRKRGTTEDSLTKNEKRKLKFQLKKERRVEDVDEFESLQDKVAFNEVVHEPPKLNIKSKKFNEERKPKNLLLNSLLENSKPSCTSKVINRSGKRKNLPVVERKKLEKQQSKAIAAYRQLKSQRLANSSC
ncbi:uncharacterized protein LOC114933785 [Nylanderia fulva]|uniref:uncharacterized protein LOC114933785 n=1 Tax=Nylanderia fulva TaxID=613905 RepID=UPI0010FAD05E|nr:uncharacterized protein LOC114933785 [Nylanderia fulva]